MSRPSSQPEVERYAAAQNDFIRAMRGIVAAVDAMSDPAVRSLLADGLMGHVEQFREMVEDLQARSPQP